MPCPLPALSVGSHPDSGENSAETEIQAGVTELSCHPGYDDPGYPTGYSAEREAELRTLCDPRIRQKLVEQSIRLVGSHDLSSLGVKAPG